MGGARPPRSAVSCSCIGRDTASNIDRFATYAAAFEKAFVSDDWSVVEPFFTENAVYEVSLAPPLGGRFEGRAAILAYFKEILDRLDRRFETREIEILDGPTENGDEVRVEAAAIYRSAGVPELRLVLVETARFEGDRICHLADHYEPQVERESTEYLNTHGERLGIRLD